MTHAIEKQKLRKEAKARIASLGAAEREAFSRSACARLEALPAFERAHTLLAYMPIRGECSPAALVERARAAGKRTAFPLCLAEGGLALYIAETEADFRPGSYGILEPDPARCARIAPNEVGLAVVPGLAFDDDCMRLGRGAGYYDRLLADFAGVKVGLAYDCQIFSRVPGDQNDVSMDYVVTNNGIIVKNPH